MHKNFAIILMLLCCPILVQAQVTHISGKIIDAATFESLAFVHIVVNDSREGTTSAIDGSFNVYAASGIGRLTFSFVGYEQKEINVEDFLKANPNISPDNFIVRLRKSTLILKELVFEAGENPADKIIKKVIDNKDAEQSRKDKIL